MPQPDGGSCAGTFSDPNDMSLLVTESERLAAVAPDAVPPTPVSGLLQIPETISFPPGDEEPWGGKPTETPEFRRELAGLLNSHGIDTYAEMPDHILADMLAELIPPLRWGRIATARWMGQPLLGEKLAARARGEGA